MPAERWVARARIALGTVVEIALLAHEALDVRFDAGFAAIAHVHAKMSAHDPTSDLSNIARNAHRRAVVVDPHTYAVLELALALWHETFGGFDVTVAPASGRQGVLPAPATTRAAGCGGMKDLRLQPNFHVRARIPVALDLGGIAKGFAVDRAVRALRGAGASAGRINAGGDLRVFGTGRWMPVRVRHPGAPTIAFPLFEVQDLAVATSADYFGPLPALFDPRDRRMRPYANSITVAAPTCALADALTKIVALNPSRAPAILARHGAHAFRIAAGRGDVRCHTTCRQSTAHLRLPETRAA